MDIFALMLISNFLLILLLVVLILISSKENKGLDFNKDQISQDLRKIKDQIEKI